MKQFIFLSLILIIGCTSNYVILDDHKISVEIADSPLERSKGLMYRESLCDDCGMLFIFESESKHSFWMKNTLIPLDMVFIDSEMNVVDVLHAQPCKTEKCPSYIPKSTSLYVLETNIDIFDNKTIGKKLKK
jgi:uncharacterized protein